MKFCELGPLSDFVTFLLRLQREIQRVRRNRLVNVEKRIEELENEWERLYGSGAKQSQ